MNPPRVDQRVAPRKVGVTDDAVAAAKTAAKRMPRLWVWVILAAIGAVFWLAVGWGVYALWFAPALPA